ncbi:hypothetical protein [Bifidobacterium bifidum]|uniref:hypothetical protein n=1 Tax=Bifidobacterium bifidum TaxID=1681 RepID=UPI0022E7837E|nr:hypothetical protein [Bifidobacterium bifidum]
MKTSELTDGMVERTAQKLGYGLDLTMVRADENGRARLGDIELMLTHKPGDLMGYDYETDAQTNLTGLAKDVLGTALCEGQFEIADGMVDRAAYALLRYHTSGPDADGFAREQWERNLGDIRSVYRKEARVVLEAALKGGAE